MKIIHCADIHLGTWRFKSDRLAEDFSISFRKMAEDALVRKADVVLISGDFFNKPQVDPNTLLQAEAVLQMLQEGDVDVLAIEGNHDASIYSDQTSWMNYLSQKGLMKLLQTRFRDGKPELKQWNADSRSGSFIDIENVRIYGLGYLGASAPKKLELLEPLIKKNGYTIAMLHGAIDMFHEMDMGNIASKDVNRLQEKVDYLALGHVHKRYSSSGWMHNPGGLENCRLDESTKEKGYFLIDTDNGSSEFIASRRRPGHVLKVDISQCSNAIEVDQCVQEAIKTCKAIDPNTKPIVGIFYQGNTRLKAKDLDNETTAAKVIAQTNAAECLIMDETSMWSEGTSSGRPSDRASIEIEEIGTLVEEMGETEYKKEEMVEFIRSFRNMALTGNSAEDIIAKARAVVDRRPLQ